MSSAARTIAIRLTADNAEPTRRALEQVGESGERALRRIDAASAGAQPALRGLAAASDGAVRAFANMGVGFGGAERAFAGIAAGAGGAMAAVAALAAATVASGVAVARAGDTATESLARLQAATGSLAAAEAAYQGLYRLSQQTGVAVSESAGAFARFALAAREVGAINSQVLALVRTVQQAGIVAGASTAETTSTVMQLGQALASGKLQGDELRSILENMPTLAEALARQLGVGVGELRKMGEEGRLTADVVLPALLRAGERINAEFEKLPPTMGRAFAALGEAMTRFAADLDRALGLSQAIARAAQGAAAAVDRGRVAVGLGTPEETARAGQTAAQGRLAGADRQAAEIERSIAALEANPRRTVPEDAILDTLRRQAAPLRADRERAIAELERYRLEVEGIEREALVRRLGEQEAAERQRAEGQRRRDTASLADLRKALDRERGIRTEHATRVRDIDALQSRGAVEAAEAGRLRAAADRERDEALRRLGDGTRETARATRDLAEAYGSLRTSASGLLTLGGADDQAITEAQRALRGSAIDPAVTRRQLAEAEAEVTRFAEVSRDAFSRIGENALDRIGNSLVDAFVKAGEAAVDFGSLARGVLASVATDLLKLGAVNPLVNAALGTSRPTLGGALSGEGSGGGLLSSLSDLGSLGSLGGLFSGGSLGGSVSGLLATPLWGQLPLQGPTLAGAPLSGLGGGVTLGGLLGGAGLGFGAGSTLSSFLANSPARQTNGTVGSGTGALAGAAIGSIIPGVGTLLGGLLGGAAGGGLGSLIGPGQGFEGGDAILGVGPDGRLAVQRSVGKRFDTGALSAGAQAQADALNAQLAAAGLRFRPGAGSTAIIGGGQSGNPRDIATAFSRSTLVQDIRADDPRVQGALDRAGATTLNGIIGVAQSAQAFATTLDGLAASVDDVTDPLEAVRRQFASLFDTARQLGFGLDQVTAAQDRALDAVRRQQREAAASQAAGVVGSLADYALRLRTANDNSGNPLSRLAAAELQFRIDSGRAADGDFRALQRVQGSAESFRGLSRDVYGTGAGFAEAEARIAAALDRIAGLDADTLTASVLNAGLDRQTDSITTSIARLQEEVSRLRADIRQAGANPLMARSA